MKLKIISFDIEVLVVEEDRMPSAKKDPILMISFCANYELYKDRKKIVLVLNRNGKNEIIEKENKIIAKFAEESAMIEKWADLVKEADIIVGYNTSGFDIPYIFDRANTLKIRGLKIGNSDDYLWNRKHVSKGLSVNTIGGIKGKILFDVLYLLRRGDESNTIKKEYNLKNLTLKWTAKEVLGIEKLDFSIPAMQEWWTTGKDEDKFIDYCSRDSELALEFVTRFRLLDKFIMLSRRSGKLMQDIIDSQGFGGLVENLLMKEFRKAERVVPCRGVSREKGNELEGAFVLEPTLGITDNLGSADYSSMYPNIIIKYNLCYTTVLQDKSISSNDVPVNIIESEEGIPYGRFVKPSVLKGIIPTILEGLMTERKALKAEMKKYEKGTAKYLQLDAEQNAAKILLNSHFGYTGEKTAKLYCWEVAASVTGSGRKQIKGTINIINKHIVRLEDGREYKLKVVIADTDSSYIQVIPADIKEIVNRDIVVRCVTEAIKKVNDSNID